MITTSHTQNQSVKLQWTQLQNVTTTPFAKLMFHNLLSKFLMGSKQKVAGDAKAHSEVSKALGHRQDWTILLWCLRFLKSDQRYNYSPFARFFITAFAVDNLQKGVGGWENNAKSARLTFTRLLAHVCILCLCVCLCARVYTCTSTHARIFSLILCHFPPAANVAHAHTKYFYQRYQRRN